MLGAFHNKDKKAARGAVHEPCTATGLFVQIIFTFVKKGEV